MNDVAMICVKGVVTGQVQMVGFRRFVRNHAQAHGVNGFANNRADGAVEVLLCGDAAAVRQVQQHVEQGPPRSVVDRVEWQSQEGGAPVLTEFTVGWTDPD